MPTSRKVRRAAKKHLRSALKNVALSRARVDHTWLRTPGRRARQQCHHVYPETAEHALNLAVHLLVSAVDDINSALAVLGMRMNTVNLADDQLMAVSIHYDRNLPDHLNDCDFTVGDEGAIDDVRDCNHCRKGIVVGHTAKFVHITMIPLFRETLVLKKRNDKVRPA